MTRWAGIFPSVLTLLFAACTGPVEQPDFPKSVSPGWHLDRVTSGGSQDANWTAQYTGPGSARVRVWAIRSVPEGLARTQNWRAQPDTVVFSSDHYFAAVDWSGADRPRAGALVRAVERAVGITQQQQAR